MKTSFLVVDDFLSDPDAMRSLALSLPFYPNPSFYQGRRSAPFLQPHLKDLFETLLRKTITQWDYPVNGVFQWCTPEDKIVYHLDEQQWAAVLYLTPDAPHETGTSFFRSKVGGWRMDPRLEDPKRMTRLGYEVINDSTYDLAIRGIFSGGFFDKTRFEEIDRVGNVYNRLVLWNAKLLHAASSYFGQSVGDARLFQIFFFDAEDR